MITNNTTFNPRLIGALYFAIFAVAFNLLAKYFLFIFKAGELLPFFSSTLLLLLLFALFGSLFSKRLVATHKPGHIFAWGMLLAITITPFYSLGLQLIYYVHNHAIYNNLHQWQDYIVLYGVMTLFFILIAGIWLIPLTGCAALLFSRRFIPGYKIYLRKQQQKPIGLAHNADDRE